MLARRGEARALRRDLHRLRGAQEAGAEEARRNADSLMVLRSALGLTESAAEADLVGEMRVIRSLLKKITDRSLAAQERREGAGIVRASAADPVLGNLSSDQILDITRAGLESNRVDLYLQPIVSLPQRKVRFYEVFSRIRNEDGQVIVPEQYLHLAEDSGLISTIDNLLLFRCIQLVRKVQREKLDVGVFVNLSSHALLDPEFFPQFVEFLERNQELHESLIFELSQKDAMNQDLALNLGRVRDLGFAFSMDRMTDLNVDFDDLARRHFRFVKVDAGKLLADDTQRVMPIHMADLREALKRSGLDLIGAKVEEEEQAVRLLDFNVDFAQGYLFGEPRPMSEAV